MKICRMSVPIWKIYLPLKKSAQRTFEVSVRLLMEPHLVKTSNFQARYAATDMLEILCADPFNQGV